MFQVQLVQFLFSTQNLLFVQGVLVSFSRKLNFKTTIRGLGIFLLLVRPPFPGLSGEHSGFKSSHWPCHSSSGLEGFPFPHVSFLCISFLLPTENWSSESSNWKITWLCICFISHDTQNLLRIAVLTVPLKRFQKTTQNVYLHSLEVSPHSLGL